MYQTASKTTATCALLLATSMSASSPAYSKETTGVIEVINTTKDENKEMSVLHFEDRWLDSSTMLEKKRDSLEKIEVSKILKDELENTKYNWRTAKGISEETKIPEDIIHSEFLKMLKDKVIFSGKKQNGERIYSTIRNYEKNTKYSLKLMDALRGKIIR